MPLHSSQLLVPSILADAHEYGSRMANGMMLVATTDGGASPPGVPRALRWRVPPPHDYDEPRELPPSMAAGLRHIAPYGRVEMQRALEFYALCGHLANRGLEMQLRNGELAIKLGLMTAGVPEDVYKLCEQL